MRLSISGHCANPQTDHPERSHERCQRNGHGSRANPQKEFVPCRCSCHLGDEVFECECGGWLAVAPWPNEDPSDVDENGNLNPVYTHVDENFTALGIECS